MQDNMIAHIEDTLKKDLGDALGKVIAEEDLDIEQLPEIDVEVPREKSHGDYATNIAMKLAGDFRRAPRQVAEAILKHFSSDIVKSTEVAGPGFINFKLHNNWLYKTLDIILQKGVEYGNINFGQNKRVLIEFVSANPTGPLHVGHSRGAVVGDVLASIMDIAGFNVDREYYVNDAGNQMQTLGKSTLIRYKQLLGYDLELPENTYSGDYLKEIAGEIKTEYGADILNKPEEEQVNFCRDFAYDRLLSTLRQDLADFGIIFDNWFSERKLHEGRIEESIDILREKGYIYEKEGALWFKATDFGDDKDRVVIKSDGEPTYLAADIAYHLDKIARGYDKLINVWGADHHGYIPRMKAVIQAFGNPADMLEVVIVQMVTLLQDGEKFQMSKRAGSFITMRDVVKEVGRDAARYFYIMRSTDSHLDFDLDLAKEQSSNNPVYYIQYAHARIHSIFDKLEDNIGDNRNLELLNSEEEIELMKLLARYPEEIKQSAASRQPHTLTVYAYELANAFHIFYNKRRVLTDDEKLSNSRLYLVKATHQVLTNLLSLLGISAPEQM